MAKADKANVVVYCVFSRCERRTGCVCSSPRMTQSMMLYCLSKSAILALACRKACCRFSLVMVSWVIWAAYCPTRLLLCSAHSRYCLLYFLPYSRRFAIRASLRAARASSLISRRRRGQLVFDESDMLIGHFDEPLLTEPLDDIVIFILGEIMGPKKIAIFCL